MYYLYTLKDPITNIVKYVGYSKNPKRRLWEHIRDAKRGLKTYKSCWVKSLLDIQQVPIMEIIKDCEYHEDILVEEINLIRNLKEENDEISGYHRTFIIFKKDNDMYRGYYYDPEGYTKTYYVSTIYKIIEKLQSFITEIIITLGT